MDIAEYKLAKTELLCPAKCQGMAFNVYPNKKVKCIVCGKISDLKDLINMNE